jgi:hypothetical protein
VAVAPVRDSTGQAIAAIGVVDVTGIFDIAAFMEQQSGIVREVGGLPSRPVEGPREGRAA